MVKTYSNIFTELDINFIFNLSEVKKAKEDIDIKSEGSIYFKIDITPEIQKILFDNLGLNLSNVPMRWIKGDTKPHVDHGQSTFNNTYLVYLTDSKGEFIVDNNSYSITKGCGYVFSEGLEHETVNTGLEPRLLLGPMSDEGFAVGIPIEPTIITANGQTDTIYFYYSSDPGVGVYYKINQTEYFGISYPITINNSNPTSTLKVLFETNIPILFTSFYFITGTSNIQFGSTSLNNDGTRPVITIDGVADYQGFIQNGNNSGNGFSNIYIYNLKISATNGSTLISNSGWIGQEYFAKGANNCYVVNCFSDGPIINNGGGIVGGYAASNGGKLAILGCSSSGNLNTDSGGIVGSFAGQNTGEVNCIKCWSTGIIGISGGGIFGSNAGDGSSSIVARSCYSTGLISDNGGGIFSRLAINGNATNCYSLGNIGINAGGIFGQGAASDGGTTNATNCYSNGDIRTTGNGIYGSNKQSGGVEANCYSTDGDWNSDNANTFLNGVPESPSVIGINWVITTLNQPYEIRYMGYTPYTINNIYINDGIPNLEDVFTQSIQAGTSTNSAIVSDKSYTILEKYGGDPSSYSTITINSTTGIISTTSSTIPGIYAITLRNTGSYNITNFELTVTGSSPPQIQTNNNSFRVSNLFSDDLENSILLAQSGNGGVVNDSFNIYDILLLELVNEALINQ